MTDYEIDPLIARKKFLKRYRRNNALIDRLEIKLQELDARIYSLKSPIISDMPKGGKTVEVSDLISEKMDLEKRINRLVKKGRIYRDDILDQIDELEDPRHATVLEAFFIECKDFDTIAEENGYTKRHVIRLYSEAIRLLSH